MIFAVVFLLSVQATAIATSREPVFKSHEQNIIDHVFNKHHDPFVRPIRRRDGKIVVHVGITYHQLIDVNEKDQIITSSIWIRQNWTNQIISWNKEQFGNITTINIEPSRVWKPDLYLYNNADESSDGSQHSFNTKVKISNNGDNLWLAPTIIKTACKINVEHFPFDEQFCDVTLGSWTYDTLRLDVQLQYDKADTSKFVMNGEWDLISVKGKRKQFRYPCCVEPYADLTYTVRIRRRTRFYYINLIVPCFVITGLSILAFKVPPDSGERITLVITNLLSMIVFLLLVADILPPISDATPWISVYYSIVMFEIGFALICTCVVLKVNFRHPSHGDMPKWFRVLVLHWMAKLFRMTPQVRMAEAQKKHFRKPKRKMGIFAALIPRFSVSRLYSPRGSLMAGEASQGARRKQSLKNAGRSDNENECNGEPVGIEQRDKYIALTEITVQDQGSFEQADESPKPQNILDADEGAEGSSGINETPAPYVRDSAQHEIKHAEAPKDESVMNIQHFPKVSLASPGNGYLGAEKECLACSHKSAIHTLVRQQEDLVRYVESLADMARDMEEEEMQREEWKLAAAVLDEFFFWVYLVMLIVSNAVVFSMIPKYDD